jgi:hypothetical protein
MSVKRVCKFNKSKVTNYLSTEIYVTSYGEQLAVSQSVTDRIMAINILIKEVMEDKLIRRNNVGRDLYFLISQMNFRTR